MSRRLDIGTAQFAEFEVHNVGQATGYGLHVASSTDADGSGMYPELFLRVDGEDHVHVVYLDAGRTGGPFIDLSIAGTPSFGGTVTSGAVISASSSQPPSADATVDASLVTPTLSIGTDTAAGAKAIGLHRFEADLGPKTDIEHIRLAIRKASLDVDCRRRSSRRQGPARLFYVNVHVPQDADKDLGRLSPLFWQANGLLSGQSGSGWNVGNPTVALDGPGSEDSTLATHTNTDPAGEPTGG